MALSTTITNALNFGALSGALANLFNGNDHSLSSYVSVTSIPVTYSNATIGNATNATTITGDSLHSITFTCVVNREGTCVFLPQNKIHSVFINPATRLPEIVAGARKKPSPTSPDVILYASLDAAMLAYKPQGSQIDPGILPNPHQLNSTTPGNILPGPGTPPGTILPPPSNGTTSPPLPYIWEGEYITIDSNDSKWNDDAFKPIIVDVTNSTSSALRYIEYEFGGNEDIWSSTIVYLINNELPRDRKAFKSIKEAIAFLSQQHLLPPTTPGTTNGGRGKRTRKNKKNKTGNRKNHQSLRMRKRRVHVY